MFVAPAPWDSRAHPLPRAKRSTTVTQRPESKTLRTMANQLLRTLLIVFLVVPSVRWPHRWERSPERSHGRIPGVSPLPGYMDDAVQCALDDGKERYKPPFQPGGQSDTFYRFVLLCFKKKEKQIKARTPMNLDFHAQTLPNYKRDEGTHRFDGDNPSNCMWLSTNDCASGSSSYKPKREGDPQLVFPVGTSEVIRKAALQSVLIHEHVHCEQDLDTNTTPEDLAENIKNGEKEAYKRQLKFLNDFLATLTQGTADHKALTDWIEHVQKLALLTFLWVTEDSGLCQSSPWMSGAA